MYKAIYDFVSDHKNILSFKAGEKFVKLDVNQPSNHGDQGKSENPPGWVYVINEDLINGFVPETYIHLEDEVNSLLLNSGLNMKIQLISILIK